MAIDDATATQLNDLHREREQLLEHESELTSKDHGGGLSGEDQNRLERVRERWADVTQRIEAIEEANGLRDEE